MGAEAALLCVLGPTASGKTALALSLAERFGGEIIVMDSAQIYRGLDIGAAKPTADECARVPHHLLGVYAWSEACSAAQWADAARQVVAEIHGRGRLPIVCGGTFLYLRALLEGFHDLPSADPVWREQAEQRLAAEGAAALHQELQRADPATAGKIHPNDSQRVLRALEILHLTGSGREAAIAADPRQPAWQGRVLKLALVPSDREHLRERIGQRFGQMLEAGLWDEVRAVYRHPDFDPALPALKAVGYRQLFAALAGQCSPQVAVERAIIASRQYAKRQLTWLRRESDLVTLDAFSAEMEPRAMHAVDQWLAAKLS